MIKRKREEEVHLFIFLFRCSGKMCVLLVIAAVLVVIALFLVYSGILHRVEVHVGQPSMPGPVDVAYKVGRGPYKNVRPFFDELGTICKGGKLFGIYYDDPGVSCHRIVVL